MNIKKTWLFLLYVVTFNECKSQENPDEVPNNLSHILQHLLSDVSLGHNISYLPQIFQGTIILNINYPESKSAVNIYNAPNQKTNKLCNCDGNSNMASKHSECNCNEKQNFSNFADVDATSTNKDFKNNANKELEHVLQSEESSRHENIDTLINDKINSTNNITDTTVVLNTKIDTVDRANFNIESKGNHIDNHTSIITMNKTLVNVTNSSRENEIATSLLSMAFTNIVQTVEKLNTTNLQKVTKKIDRLHDLTKTNATVSYQKKTDENIPLNFEVNNENIATRDAVIQESIINFQQYIPPLLNSSFVENTPKSDNNLFCPFPTKCVYLMYCTADGRTSSSPVILNLEEEKLRNKLLDCADEYTGRTGKCCVDPISGD